MGNVSGICRRRSTCIRRLMLALRRRWNARRAATARSTRTTSSSRASGLWSLAESGSRPRTATPSTAIVMSSLSPSQTTTPGGSSFSENWKFGEASMFSKRVITNIYSYTRPNERLELKLVNIHWYQTYAKHPMRDEKIVVDSTEPSTRIVDKMASSHFEHRIVEFRYLNLDDYTSRFWARINARADYLQFTGCTVSADTVLTIVTVCTDLIGLSVHSPDTELKYMCKALEELMRQEVTIDKLRTFVYRASNITVEPSYFFNVLLTVFPRLNNLNIKLRKSEVTMVEMRSSGYAFGHKGYSEKLAAHVEGRLRQMAGLNLEMTDPETTYTINIIPPSLLSGLKAWINLRSLAICLTQGEEDMWQDLLRCLPQLEMLKWSLHLSYEQSYFEKAFAFVLDNCPKLRTLKVTHCKIFCLNVLLMTKLRASKLTKLTIGASLFFTGDLENIGRNAFFGGSERLKILKIHVYNSEHYSFDRRRCQNFVGTLMRHIPNLETLHCDYVDHMILEHIFTHQKNLKSLYMNLKYVVVFNDFVSSIGDAEKLAGLTNLEYLCIDANAFDLDESIMDFVKSKKIRAFVMNGGVFKLENTVTPKQNGDSFFNEEHPELRLFQIDRYILIRDPIEMHERKVEKLTEDKLREKRKFKIRILP